MRYNFLAVLSSILLLLGTSDTSAQRAIPENNLAYPVLILLSNGKSASGFYLQDSHHFYLVTARHLLFTQPDQKLAAGYATLLSYPPEESAAGRLKMEIDLKALYGKNLVLRHPTQDVAVVRIGDIKALENKKYILWLQETKRIESISDAVTNVSIESCKKFADVLTGNDVYIFGYPRSLGIKNIPQLDYDKPLLRKGIVAGKNEKQKTIIIDCPSYGGNSGGIVVEVEPKGLSRNFRVIGVLSQFVPFAEQWENKTHGYTNVELSNSGYSVVTPIDMVLELLPTKKKSGEQKDSGDKK